LLATLELDMQLVLVQHGEALAETVDPARPLTKPGREDVERLAAFLQQVGLRVARVVHSGKLRASDSAAILIPAVGMDATVEVMKKGLSPKDSPVYLSEAANTWQEDTLIVGHQPFMSRLTSRLVLGAEQPLIVDFTPGAALCLARRAVTGAWFIAWMVPPELLRR
jgi:phosphohistidine phosphatase